MPIGSDYEINQRRINPFKMSATKPIKNTATYRKLQYTPEQFEPRGETLAGIIKEA